MLRTAINRQLYFCQIALVTVFCLRRSISQLFCIVLYCIVFQLRIRQCIMGALRVDATDSMCRLSSGLLQCDRRASVGQLSLYYNASVKPVSVAMRQQHYRYHQVRHHRQVKPVSGSSNVESSVGALDPVLYL